MARSRVIPNYDLYGDSSRIEDSVAFNFEWIPQRSSLYNWLIHPHRHDSFIQVLYLTQGQVDVQIEHAHQTLHAPCVMLIPAGHVHGFRFSQDTQGPVVTAMQKPLESAAGVMMPALLETIRTPACCPCTPRCATSISSCPCCWPWSTNRARQRPVRWRRAPRCCWR